MLKSYEQLYTDLQTQTVDTDSATLSYFKTKLNEGITKAYAVLNAEYFYYEATDLTVDGQNSYPLPAQCDKIHTVKTTVSSEDYVALEWSGTEAEWNSLTDGISSTESDYPQHFFVKRDTIELYPTPSTDDYVLTFKCKTSLKELTSANFTTESIKTAVVGSTAIVGNTGTTWTSAMADRFLKITADGVWYRIASVTNATNLVLSREWAGTAITAGTEAYIIGECSLLPSDFQTLPMSFALWQYYLLKEKSALAKEYKTEWEEGLKELTAGGGNNTTSGIISEDIEIKNANDYPTNLS